MILKKTSGNKFEKYIIKCFLVVVLATFALLTYLSIKSSWINVTIDNEFVSFKQDSILNNVLSVLLLTTCVLFLRTLTKEIRNQNIILFVSLVIIFCIGLFWLLTCGAFPIADQYNCMYAAHLLNIGDYSWLEKGGYVALNPHLLGLISLYRIIFIFAGDLNYIAIRLVNLFLAILMVYSGYKIVEIVSEEKVSKNIFLFLMIFCIPIYGYIAFVYGEIPSIAFILLSIWMYLKFYKTQRKKYLMSMFIFSAISILMKQNSLIIYIGLIISSSVKTISTRDVQNCFVVFVLVVAMIVPSKLMDIFYPRASEAKEIPPISYIAMGLNKSQEDLGGWFNGYNYDVYEYFEYDEELMKIDSMNEINQFLNNSVSEQIEFFMNKINTQWNAPSYQCIAMNNSIKVNGGRLAYYLYYEDGMKTIESFCNVYQLTIYLFVTFVILYGLFKDDDIEKYSLLIGIFGGFLFSLIWEAKTRYIFPYFVMLIPYATLGIEKMALKIEEIINAH